MISQWRNPKQVPFEESACRTCYWWQDGDCREESRDAVGTWQVPADVCSGYITLETVAEIMDESAAAQAAPEAALTVAAACGQQPNLPGRSAP